MIHSSPQPRLQINYFHQRLLLMVVVNVTGFSEGVPTPLCPAHTCISRKEATNKWTSWTLERWIFQSGELFNTCDLVLLDKQTVNRLMKHCCRFILTCFFIKSLKSSKTEPGFQNFQETGEAEKKENTTQQLCPN